MWSPWPSSATANPQKNSILVVDDDPLIADLIQSALEQEGYAVIVAGTGHEAIEAALEHQPHLIVLDVMLPDMDGMSVCRTLRSNGKTSAIPIVMISALDTMHHKVTGLNLGADDYIAKPFHVPELLARIRTQLRHVANTHLSELTGLPGNTIIEHVIRTELERGGNDLSILYIDLDNFKAYNDAYGFRAGNEMIRLMAQILRNAVEEYDREHGFCGHVGGDDFVVVTRTPAIEELCQTIIRRFEERRTALYRPDDRERGYIVSTDRRGHPQHFPLASLSIGVVRTHHRTIKDEWEVSHIAADVKKKAKSLDGSAYYIDQRETF